MFSRSMTVGVVLGTMVGTTAIAPAALAGDRQGRYASGPAYEYARVLNVEPIVRQVRVETPQRECWTEEQYQQPRQAGVAGNMILGGLIGGVIGSRFGDGDGRRAATAAGVLIGSSIGHDVGERRRAAQAQGPYDARVRTVERCGVRYVDNYEERIEGYDVEYEYGGQRYHTRMPYDPGERMRIRVDVRPVNDTHGGRYDDDDDYYED